MKVACFSVAALDYFSQQDEYFAGGNSLNQCIRFNSLGCDSIFVGALGKDSAGDKIEALLRGKGVDCTRVHRLDGETANNILLNDENGERFGVDGAWRGGVYEEYKLNREDWRYISDCDLWSVPINSPSFAEVTKQKSTGQKLSSDFLHLKDYESLSVYQGALDLVFFGGEESMAKDLHSRAKELSMTIVLTLGAAGSVAFQGDQVFRQAALAIEKVVDTTGCGDAFQAGFSQAFVMGASVEDALLAGARLGRQAASHYGGVQW